MKTIQLQAGRNKEVPVIVPPADLTIKQIQDQIPAKYFERDTFRSMMYLARDLVQVAVTYYLMYHFAVPMLSALKEHAAASTHPQAATFFVGLVKLILWNAFWLVQGLNFTALWILAHECGHQAFSPSRQVNNTVGFVVHSAVLVPYHSWRISHGNHHKHTNHLTKDNVFVPRKENKVIELVEETPLAMLWGMFVMFLFGWPGYLLFNVASQDYGRRANHFEPSSPLFRPEERHDVILSDIGILAVLSVLGVAVCKYGFTSVLCWYIVPYLWLNFWLLFITYLQHSDIRVPHYAHNEWTFTRGAIAAVDRDYGYLLNVWLHHINDSHVVHHLFSQMPFYNAILVTRKYIKGALGESYVEDARPLLTSLRRTWTDCRYVIPSEGISVFYGFNKSRNE